MSLQIVCNFKTSKCTDLKCLKSFILLSLFFSGIPIGIFQSMFQVVALETFNLPADQNGYLMAYIGVLTMVCRVLTGFNYYPKSPNTTTEFVYIYTNHVP